MAWLKRNKSEDPVLPEIDKYYDGERRDRSGVAWLLAIVSVLLVAGFIAVLFLAGRWGYQKFIDRNRDNNGVSWVNEPGIENLPTFDGDTEQDQTSEPSNDESVNQQPPSPVDTPPYPTADQEITPEGRVDAPAQTETPSQPDTPATKIPSSGDEPLPGTGPEDTLPIFIIVATFATAAHYLVNKKKTT